MKIVIVNYGMGNIHSVQKKIQQLGAGPVVSADYRDILKADKLVLPGVGHFGRAMENLSKNNIADALSEAVLVKKTPVLGICLGMQLMAGSSEEGAAKGLGWLDAEVVRFNVSNTLQYKVPHTGWNTLHQAKTGNPLFAGVHPAAAFYFVHAYHVVMRNKAEITCSSDYDGIFTAAIQKEHIYGVQFHPEKSHDAGQQLFQNFIRL